MRVAGGGWVEWGHRARLLESARLVSLLSEVDDDKVV